jgi:Rrf2 family protein
MPLRKAGFVQSYQGVRGGYELSRPPERIAMGPVLRVLEGALAPMFCVTDVPDRDTCAFEDHCGTRVLWARVRDGINAALDATMLADLLVAGADDREGTPVALAVPVSMGAGECAEYRPQPASARQ